MEKQKKLGQFFTPVWAADILFQEHFSHLDTGDLVWEPTCGTGNFLSVIPARVPAIGTEIDPELISIAKKNTGRPVICGDFRTVQFERLHQVTAVIGNPPFELKLFEEFMQRCENILPLGKKAGFIIPAYFFQTSQTFMRFARKWEISQWIIPRDIFKGEETLSKPIIFATFVRENTPKMVGFRLHAELCDVAVLYQDIRDIVSRPARSGSVWKDALIHIVQQENGIVTLDQVYARMEKKRPTENRFWKEQIRKVIQQHPFERVGNSTYKLIHS